jgi:hypothetical protein
VQNESRAFNAGAIEAVVTAMSLHADCALVQETASVAMRNLTGGNMKYTARAGISGAVEALVEAMRRHTKSPGVQSSACVLIVFPDRGQGGEQNSGAARGCEEIGQGCAEDVSQKQKGGP